MSHRLSLIAAIVITVGSNATAFAENGPPYDATYSRFGPSIGITMHVISDGKGHEWSEMNVKGKRHFLGIMDWPAQIHTTFNEAQKTAMKVPIKDTPHVVDAQSAQKYNAKSLGSKVISGHPCHGWEYSASGVTNQAWIGDDIKCLVKSETTNSTGSMGGMELTTYKSTTPSAAQFEVPADYKLVKMPGQ